MPTGRLAKHHHGYRRASKDPFRCIKNALAISIYRFSKTKLNTKANVYKRGDLPINANLTTIPESIRQKGLIRRTKKKLHLETALFGFCVHFVFRCLILLISSALMLSPFLINFLTAIFTQFVLPMTVWVYGARLCNALQKKNDLYNDSKLQFLHLAALNYGKIFRTTSWIDYHIIIIAYQELVLIPTRSTFPIIKHSFFLRARFVRSLCRVAMYLCGKKCARSPSSLE